MKKIGVIINPIAGLGGRVGLKGSDGADIIERALALGGKPESSIRAGYALEQLADVAAEIEFFAYAGDMGENQLKKLGYSVTVIGRQENEARSTSDDTIAAAKRMMEENVDILIFAGGDGTARNICEAVGTELPVIGIPAGVKIHSAVYAINPRNAGMVAKDFVAGRVTKMIESEVMDIDEELFRQGRVIAKLYGYMMVPDGGSKVQNMKAGGASEAAELMGMAEYVADSMEEDTIYIIGPGSTTRSIMEELKLPNTLLGVDVIKNKKLLASDISELELWNLLQKEKGKVKIIVTLIGGQGNLFGRGNQQISPRIIRYVGKGNIIVVSGTTKLVALHGRPLLVDTGDPQLDQELCGYIEVAIGYQATSICTVSN